MRIAIVAPAFPPHLGGVEVLADETSQALAALGHDVEVWTMDRPEEAADAHRGTVTERRGEVVVRRFHRTASHRFPVSPALARHVRGHARDVDVLHLHNYHSMVVPLALLVPAQVPVVISPHFHGGGHSRAADALHVPYGFVGRRALRRADALVAVSEAERELLAAHVATDTVSVVHNGTDTAAITAAVSWSAGVPVVLVVGRLEAHKRVDAVIDAFRAARPDAQLVIVGDGPARRRLEESTAGTSTLFTGAVERGAVYRWLRTARVVVTMSEREAFGITALEAATAGAAVLASDIPAHREVARLAAGRIRLTALDDLPSALLDALDLPVRPPVALRSWADVAADYLRVYMSIRTTR